MAEQKQPTPEQSKESARPKVQDEDDARKQAREDALSPDEKHQNYLDDLERLHRESVVGPDKRTPPTG